MSDTVAGAYPRASKFAAGYVSGMCLVLVGHPFDTIKVRLQTQGADGKFVGMTDCVKQTVAKEGIRGVYKGFKHIAIV
jgi:solute carrier family 25 carnitine/acylcarnitine transporter 20/29